MFVLITNLTYTIRPLHFQPNCSFQLNAGTPGSTPCIARLWKRETHQGIPDSSVTFNFVFPFFAMSTQSVQAVLKGCNMSWNHMKSSGTWVIYRIRMVYMCMYDIWHIYGAVTCASKLFPNQCDCDPTTKNQHSRHEVSHPSHNFCWCQANANKVHKQPNANAGNKAADQGTHGFHLPATKKSKMCNDCEWIPASYKTDWFILYI